MKIESLAAENLLGFDSARFGFGGSGVVNFIGGPNGGGKSSVGNLIEFALTGLTREIEAKKDAGWLARNGADGAAVELAIDGAQLRRTTKSCNVAEGDIRARYGWPEMLAAVLNAARIIELSPAERRELIKAIACDPAKISAAVREHCAGLPESEAAELAALAAKDIDRAERQAVERRREAGRLLEACGEQPPATVTIDGKEWDLADASAAAIEKRLRTLEAEHKAALQAQGAAESRSEELEKLKKRAEEIARHLFEHPAPSPEEMRELRKAKDSIDGDVEIARKALVQAEAAKISAKAEAVLLSKLEGKPKCPTCRRDLDEKSMMPIRKAAYDRGNAAYEQHAQAAEKWKAVEAATAAAVKAHTEGAESQRQASELLEVKRRIAEIDGGGKKAVDVTELEARLNVGRELQRRKAEFDAASTRAGRRSDYEAQRTAWDTVAKALGESGPIRKLAAAGFAVQPVIGWAGELLPGISIQVRDDWEILADGIPARIILSESERLRLGMCFAAALSMASGVGVLFVDRLDCLEERLRPQVLDWLADRSEELETVICAARVAEPPAPQEWLRVWWVAEGKAEEVKL